MKSILTRAMTLIVALVMVLSLVACGEDTPAETTPEATTPEATTPEATTPEATTPETTTPEATTPKETVDPDRPKEPTWETYCTDLEIKIDGVLEKAYYKGVYLIAEINMVASGSTFDVFMTADSENIYVFYEFTKAEEIFWDETYEFFYHFDCADFVLGLDGVEGRGAEFRIMAGVEGGNGVAIEKDALKYGVSDYYVKHTEKGYNVEFSIPLSSVTGKDASGNKMISFTALSTITTAWDDKTAAPARKYPVACKAAGAEAKESPSFLVVKGTATVE